MEPVINNISLDEDLYKFTLSNVNVSVANAIRRIILSEIPTTVIYTETYQDNQCKVLKNTTRLHNEILKQRLSCIPIHIKELDILPGNYVLEVNVKNDSDSMKIITTEDFKIKNKKNGNYLTIDETRKIFPSSPKTNMFIDFARLRPAMGEVPGEELILNAEFSVHTAKENSMFNVASTCSYGNTVDVSKAEEIWNEYESKLESEQISKKDIEMQKKNFYILDAQRYYIENSFDFNVQSVGVYESNELVKLACKVLSKKLEDMMTSIDSDLVPIRMSEVTMENSFDIILENEDYTMVKLLEYMMHEYYYEGEKILNFCGFKKFHPHNDDSTLRIAFNNPADKHMVSQYLKNAASSARDIFKMVYGSVKSIFFVFS